MLSPVAENGSPNYSLLLPPLATHLQPRIKSLFWDSGPEYKSLYSIMNLRITFTYESTPYISESSICRCSTHSLGYGKDKNVDRVLGDHRDALGIRMRMQIWILIGILIRAWLLLGFVLDRDMIGAEVGITSILVVS